MSSARSTVRRPSRPAALLSAYLLVGALACVSCGAPEAAEKSTPELTLEPMARYGSRDEEGSSLTRPVGLVAGDSLVLILETDPPRIAVFARSGDWSGDIGRVGDGPGEFRRPSHIGRVEDLIWVGDARGGRLETFDRHGAPRDSHRWDVEPDSLGARAFPIALFRDGTVLAGPGGLSIGSAAVGRIRHRSYYQTDPSGLPLTNVYREVLDPADFFAVDLESGYSIVGMSELRSSPLVAPFPDGTGLVVVERPEATGPRATFRILVLAPAGHAELDREVEYQPVSAEGWLDEYISRVEQEMLDRRGTVDRDIVDGFRSGIPARRSHPPVTRLRVGQDGSIWLRREESRPDSVAWDLFSRSGEFMGRLETAKATDIIGGSATEVWTVEHDELDVPFVVHSRVLR